jgi:hypothetical protein
MDSNTHSIGLLAEPPTRHSAGHPGELPGGRSGRLPAGHPTGPSGGLPTGLSALAAAVEELAAHDLGGLPDPVAAERVLGLRRLLDRLEGHWLKQLAAVDARGAAGAEADGQAGSTAGWLRARLRMGPVRPAARSGPPGPWTAAP